MPRELPFCVQTSPGDEKTPAFSWTHGSGELFDERFTLKYGLHTLTWLERDRGAGLMTETSFRKHCFRNVFAGRNGVVLTFSPTTTAAWLTSFLFSSLFRSCVFLRALRPRNTSRSRVGSQPAIPAKIPGVDVHVRNFHPRRSALKMREYLTSLLQNRNLCSFYFLHLFQKLSE